MCEVCKFSTIADVHHIIKRSKFGSRRKEEQDSIENLIGLCRSCHERSHRIKQPHIPEEDLLEIHNANMEQHKNKMMQVKYT